MNRKRKINQLQAEALAEKKADNYRVAVSLAIQIIELSLSAQRKYINEARQAFQLLGDIYTEAQCILEATLLYRMASGFEEKMKYILLQKFTVNTERAQSESKQNWLRQNMLDVTSIIKSADNKHWCFLFDNHFA